MHKLLIKGLLRFLAAAIIACLLVFLLVRGMVSSFAQHVLYIALGPLHMLRRDVVGDDYFGVAVWVLICLAPLAAGWFWMKRPYSSFLLFLLGFLLWFFSALAVI